MLLEGDLTYDITVRTLGLPATARRWKISSSEVRTRPVGDMGERIPLRYGLSRTVSVWWRTTDSPLRVWNDSTTSTPR